MIISKENVQQSIENAFANVSLETGIGLNEAQAVDDYESELEQKQSRQKDEKDDWSLLKPSELQRCYSSLSFFDADGMRFHLPAYIIAELKEEIDNYSLFHLTHLDDYAQSQLTSLNREQRQAIALYLEWCLQQNDYEFEHAIIKRALSEYWQNLPVKVARSSD